MLATALQLLTFHGWFAPFLKTCEETDCYKETEEL